jgi:hypothetical protein
MRLTLVAIVALLGAATAAATGQPASDHLCQSLIKGCESLTDKRA